MDFDVASGRKIPKPEHMYHLDVPGRCWGGEPPALRIRRCGRFGNNIIQIVHAAHIAQLTGVRTLYIGEVNVGAIGWPWPLAGLWFSPFPPLAREATLSGTFFYRDPFPREFSGFGGADLWRIVASVVAPMLRNRWGSGPGTSEDTLHIHIRSGDVFAAKSVNPHYVPPPLAFYTQAIRHFQQTYRKPKIVIVFEDRRNPCIDLLCHLLCRNGIPFSTLCTAFDATVGELLSARNLISSVGTFVPMIALASTHIRRIYGFRGIFGSTGLAAKGTKVFLVRDAGGRYIERGTWRNTPMQLRQIIDYPAVALQIV